MKHLLFFVFIIFTILFIYFYYGKKEKLDMPTVYRATNTVLTATPYTDKMDRFPLPENIDSGFNEWIEKGFVSPVKDQMLCGGCWAFAACSILADRLTIATNGHWYAPYGLSEQYLISCGENMNITYYQGCEGGIPGLVVPALSKHGVPADSECGSCKNKGKVPSTYGTKNITRTSQSVVNPFISENCMAGGNVYAPTSYTWWQTGCDGSTTCSLSSVSACPCSKVSENMEKNQTEETPFKIRYKTIGNAHSYTLHGNDYNMKTVDLWPEIPLSTIKANIIRMKKAIYYEGPLMVGFRVTQDFYDYWPYVNENNYYRYDGVSPMTGGHAVVIVGWKTMPDGAQVWIVKNSWGTSGGYGFSEPKWINPATGKKESKYPGGFWNHYMGDNDSFIESNAVGAYPDLSMDELAPYLPSKIPEKWYENFTLRSVYQMTSDIKGEPRDNMMRYRKDSIASISGGELTVKHLTDSFMDKKLIFIIGSKTQEELDIIINSLPLDKNLLQNDIQKLSIYLQDIIKGNIVIAAKGAMNNYFYMSGKPEMWKKSFNFSYIHKVATLDKFVNNIYIEFEKLGMNAKFAKIYKN